MRFFFSKNTWTCLNHLFYCVFSHFYWSVNLLLHKFMSFIKQICCEGKSNIVAMIHIINIWSFQLYWGFGKGKEILLSIICERHFKGCFWFIFFAFRMLLNMTYPAFFRVLPKYGCSKVKIWSKRPFVINSHFCASAASSPATFSRKGGDYEGVIVGELNCKYNRNAFSYSMIRTVTLLLLRLYFLKF